MVPTQNLEFAFENAPPPVGLLADLAAFKEFGTTTRLLEAEIVGPDDRPVFIPKCINEFWTARQRQANSLHEISYRACFKPQLPRFFMERLTVHGDVVYDPFMGRGTTLIEAALLGRVPVGCDVNPLSQVMAGGRLTPPSLDEVGERLGSIDLNDPSDMPNELLAFYHAETLRGISSLKNYFQKRRSTGELDRVDLWLEMVSLNRLTGHSPGFFSVYTMPPNQAVSAKSQLKINERRVQIPPVRDIAKIILKKSRQLLKSVDEDIRSTLGKVVGNAQLITGACDQTPTIPSGSVSLVVTSPPFLDIVDYATDNWLRCWFLGIDAKNIKLTVPKKIDQWSGAMTRVFHELYRVLKPGGHVAFEVGEVHKGKMRLEEAVVPCGMSAGLTPELILINDQEFTKTANCWGVDNNSKGTNTNRIVLFRKP